MKEEILKILEEYTWYTEECGYVDDRHFDSLADDILELLKSERKDL